MIFFRYLRNFIHQQPPKLMAVYRITFVVALTMALIDPFLSNFIRDMVGSESVVGLVFSGSLVFSIVVNLVADNIFARLGRDRTLIIFIALLAVGYTLLFYTSLPLVFMAVFSLVTISKQLIFFANDMYVKHYGRGKILALVEGQYYTFINMAWFIGPLLGGYIISLFHIRMTFLMNALFVALLLLFFLRQKPSLAEGFRYQASKNLIQGIRSFFRSRPFRAAYVLYFGLIVFYSMNGIYLPLRLFDLGADSATIGLIFSLSMLPFIFLEYFFNRLASRYNIERKFFALGFFLLAVAEFAIFSQRSVFWIGVAAIIGMVGASMIEALVDTYFLHHMKERNVEPLSIFRTAWGLAWLVAPLFGSAVTYFSNMKMVFITMSGLLLVFSVYGLFVPKMKKEAENRNKL